MIQGLDAKYEVLEKLSEGGMGAVFKVRHKLLEEVRVIKTIRAQFQDDEQLRQRFLNEAKAAARLRHPNIAHLYDFSITDDGTAFMVMEFIDGLSLDQLVQRSELLPVDLVLELVGQSLSALRYLHQKGFVHRDVSPDNLMAATDTDGLPLVKLIDLGIARDLGEADNLTRPGLFLGKVRYASPEAFGSGGATEVDERSDIYSLGVVLYEALTSEYPYEGSDHPKIIAAHLFNEPKSFDETDPTGRLPDNLRQLVLAMLSKKPAERPSSDDIRDSLSRLSSTPKSELDIFAIRPVPKSELPERTPPPGKQDDPRPSTQAKELPEFDDVTKIEPTISASEFGALHEQVQEQIGESQLDKTFIAPRETFPQAAIAVTHALDTSQTGLRVSIAETPFYVGRAPDCDLIINDPVVSRRHLRINRDGNAYFVEDLGSSTGSSRNGRRLEAAQPQPLYLGDTIVLSRESRLAFVTDFEHLPDLSGLVLDDRYQLVERLHEGPKADTYESQDQRTGAAVATKILSPDFERFTVHADEFRRQAETAAQLEHKNICRVTDFSETTAMLESGPRKLRYLCMALMRGGSLASITEADEPAPIATVLSWMSTVASALDFAHSKGIIHGGIKPTCIVFDHIQQPYLTDFAWAAKEDDPSEYIGVGAPSFMAPEQWDLNKLTRASDQFALAAVTYLLLTGSRPFLHQEDPENRRRNFQRPVEPAHREALQNKREGITEELSQVLARALSVEPDDRYSSAGEFASELKLAAEGTARDEKGKRIFLSYHRESSGAWALYLSGELERKHGIQTFVDTEKRERVRFPTKIQAAIEQCDVFVCLLDAKTLDSDWVNREIKIAHELKKPMVPVLQEGFPEAIPESKLTPEIESLLQYDFVYLLDKKQTYLKHAISELAKLVRGPQESLGK